MLFAAGYAFDSEEWAIKNSTDVEATFAAVFSSDEDRLYFRKDGGRGHRECLR
jgi:hypothetical protein